MNDDDSLTPEPRLRVVSAAATPQASNPTPTPPAPPVVTFDRHELGAILNLYGRKVAAGEWRDYAIDFGRQVAVFSIYRRASEVPLYRIEKDPRLARKQGAYAVVATGGLVMKRGSDLSRVIAVLDKTVRLVRT
ncbi:MAG: hypothetical protein JWN07_1058 [Hyphomicrobiales bacterium]|nr:hypothetical protein [Hyphomicrobiales bacterium]